MKIVVISDTHIPDRASELPMKLLEEIKTADMVIHTGDFVSPGLLEKLKSMCKNVHAVWGNMDPEDIKKQLPEKEIFKAGNYKIGIVHGYGSPSKIGEILAGVFKEVKLDIIVFGHTHSALNEKRGETLFFNPGSPTDKVFSTTNSYGIIEINGQIQSRIVEL